MATESPSEIKTTQTSLDVIDALMSLDGANMEDLSEHLGLAVSTVHRHISTLRDRDFVVKHGEEYRIGLRFLTIGGYAQRQVTAFPLIKQKVDMLARETGERVQFIVEEHGKRVYLYTDVGESAVQTGAHTGKRGKIHTSAAGKAILAELPRERVRRIIDARDLSISGPNTITSADDLFEELERVRERGYAFNREETTVGVHAVGAAVKDENGVVIGALSVSGPANRLKGTLLEEELPGLILGATNEIELNIKHS